MRTFAIVNRKGGVGKTTTAVNLSYVLATSCRLRVLLIDADGQANATGILLPKGEYAGLGALLRGYAICYDELTVHTDVEGLDVLPASEDLWAMELEKDEAALRYSAMMSMRDAIAEDDAYDVIIVDCPPNLSVACISAILASDAVIIPVLSDACSATGVVDLMDQIDSLRYIRPEIRVAGVLVNQWHRSPVVEDAAAYLREDGRVPVYTEELYAKRVLEDPSVTDESYFVMIRELDEGDNPHDEAAWAKSNPCLRYPSRYSQILLKQIRDEHNAAYASNDPDKIRKFLTRRMCLWQVGSVNHYLDENCMAKARKAMVPRETFAALTDGLSCHCGYDLGKRIDLSGAAAVFDLPDGRVAIKMHGFIPENGAQRHEKTDRVPYLFWAKDGYCTLTPGDVTDNSYVYNWICAGEREHGWKVEEVDYDGHNATDLAIRMNEDRNREDFCVEVAQTCAGQNLAVKTFRELLLQDRVVLEESPLTLWCLQNAIEIQNNYGDLKLSKRHKDDTERIDPVAAAMNALARLLVKRTVTDLNTALERGDFTF